ncbi:BCCT family transporter [Streptomyces sp. NPDC051940]|uniref:BCCT family transporter n=1 Tax=Streptomyces sp. NPDC051940 TaxID=3155675 RepID=UPI00341E851E
MSTVDTDPPRSGTPGPGSPEGPPAQPDTAVLTIGVVAVLAVVAWGAFANDSLDSASSTALDWVLRNFGWLFVVAADIFLVLLVVVAVSRYGRLRLGKDEERPEFSNLAWIAMMFSAGMGIGLMFFGVGEPLTHYVDPPPASGAKPQTDAAAATAMEYSFFHWTLHPWAIYGVAALALAYSSFRKGRGNRLSAAFTPLIGIRAADGWPGRCIDLLAVFATVFGTATSLGLGALQVAEGLDITADIDTSTTVQVIIIIALTAAFVVSAFTGLHKGVKWLSTLNILLAALLMLFVFLFGPTVYVLNSIPASLGNYLFELIPMSTRTGAYTDPDWLGSWTIFYWAWWLSWAPFVGTFLARISRGRSIREFLIGVLLVPSGATMIWFCVMGGSAIRLDQQGTADMASAVDDGAEAALFELLKALPLGAITSVIAMVLVMTYFVTSADSASLVMGSLSSRGALHPQKSITILWGVLMGSVAAVLLVAGGLTGLQTATILVALPFVLVMLALCVSMFKDMSEDPGLGPKRGHPEHGLRDAVRVMVGEAMSEHGGTGNGTSRHYRLRRAAAGSRERGNGPDPQDGPRT